MHTFDIQGIEINAPRDKVFEFLRLPENLPRWAKAFVSGGNGQARLEAPGGAVHIGLNVIAYAEAGTVDWRLEFPDGGVGFAQSRVTETMRGTCIYSFVLHAPPVALEQIEGALEAQRAILRSELAYALSHKNSGYERRLAEPERSEVALPLGVHALHLLTGQQAIRKQPLTSVHHLAPSRAPEVRVQRHSIVSPPRP